MLSGPLSSRSFSILALISSSAWSHEIRWYLPSTSFIGYLSRNSPCAFSRSAPPLAQCPPRLIGESNTGSWRTQTPFSTTASTAQPTEQWVHTVRRTSSLPPSAAAAVETASALRTRVSWVAAMPAPRPRPDRRRNLRRSIVGTARVKPRARLSTSVRDDDVAPSPADLRVNSMLPPVGRSDVRDGSQALPGDQPRALA